MSLAPDTFTPDEAAHVRTSSVREQRLADTVTGLLPPHLEARVDLRVLPSVDTGFIMPATADALTSDAGLDADAAAHLADSIDGDYLIAVTGQPADTSSLPISDQATVDRAYQHGIVLHELLHLLLTNVSGQTEIIEQEIDSEAQREKAHELLNIGEDGVIEAEARRADAFTDQATTQLTLIRRIVSQPLSDVEHGAEFSFWDAVTGALYDYAIFPGSETYTGVGPVLADPDDDRITFASDADEDAFLSIHEPLKQLAADLHGLRNEQQDSIRLYGKEASIQRARRLTEFWTAHMAPFFESEDRNESSPDSPQESGEEAQSTDADNQDSHDKDQQAQQEQQSQQGPQEQQEQQGQQNSAQPDSEDNTDQSDSKAGPDQPAGQPDPEAVTTERQETDETPLQSITDHPDIDPQEPEPDDVDTEPNQPSTSDPEQADENTDESQATDSQEARSGADDQPGADEPETSGDTEANQENTSPEADTSDDSAGDHGSEQTQGESQDDSEDASGTTASAEDGPASEDPAASSGSSGDTRPNINPGSSDGSSGISSGQSALGDFALGQNDENDADSDISRSGEEEEQSGDNSIDADSDERSDETDGSEADAGSPSEDADGESGDDETPHVQSENADTNSESDTDGEPDQPDDSEADDTDATPSEGEETSQSDSDGQNGSRSEPSAPSIDPEIDADALESDAEKAREEIDQTTPNTDAVNNELDQINDLLEDTDDDPTGEQSPGGQGAGSGSLTSITTPETGQTEPTTQNSVADQQTWATIEAESEQVADTLANVLAMDKQSDVIPGQTSGRVDPAQGYKLSYGDPRAFERKTPGDEKEYALVLVLDRSGSMGGYRSNEIEPAVQAVATFAAAAEDLGINVAVIDFYRDEARLIKPFSVDVEYVQDALLTTETGGGTPLSDALELAKALVRRQQQEPLIITMTDGQPASPGAVAEQLGEPPVCSLTLATTSARNRAPPGAAELEGKWTASRTVFNKENLTEKLDTLASLLTGI
ncbi:von Willebrand factor type A domain-containing protein [Halorientalis persicus]|uniref:von Willebrand factor type A domain-containing protein n=1 Tax=Halorientalis persicus TaxID=1367881 RepID=A0A1H8UAN1_9EURY|nr:VWA domain-containing protein [Halorientalis persicus]SEP00156.1 von Willebrand factor type A domain-containing protein [Halorientalis persicus]